MLLIKGSPGHKLGLTLVLAHAALWPCLASVISDSHGRLSQRQDKPPCLSRTASVINMEA